MNPDPVCALQTLIHVIARFTNCQRTTVVFVEFIWFIGVVHGPDMLVPNRQEPFKVMLLPQHKMQVNSEGISVPSEFICKSHRNFHRVGGEKGIAEMGCIYQMKDTTAMPPPPPLPLGEKFLDASQLIPPSPPRGSWNNLKNPNQSANQGGRECETVCGSCDITNLHGPPFSRLVHIPTPK